MKLLNFYMLLFFVVSINFQLFANPTHCKLKPSNHIEFSDGSCTYPENKGLIKMDEGFEDGETKFIYLKVDGPACLGEILVNPKGGPHCYTDLRIAGPVWLSEGGACNTSLSEIGTYKPDCVSDLNESNGGNTFVSKAGHTIEFHGWETKGDGTSIWYYEVTSANKQAISHLTFALVNSKTACGSLNSLGSLLWVDLNNNGLQDDGTEAGMGGVKVSLYKDGVATGQSQTTDAFGKYLFVDLSDGTYRVKFERPEGYRFTAKTMGNGQNDSKVDEESGMSDPVTLSGGEEYMYSDAGLVLIPLPIKLSSFNAVKRDDKVLLIWETASEVNSDYFEVQKSIDGYTFQTMSLVKAANHSSTILKYSSVDSNPSTGINMYRLKQVDIDGSFSYSDVRAVHLVMDDSSDPMAYPNPFTTQMTIKHSLTGSVRGDIYNASGVQVREFTMGPIESVLNLQDLDSGVYYIIIRNDRVQKALKVVKN